HELGVISANLLLDSLNIVGKFDAYGKYLEKFSTNPDLMKDAEFKKFVDARRGELTWKQAEMLRDHKKFREAAQKYVDTYNGAPDGPRAAQALYSACIMYDAARLVGKAIQCRQNLIKYKGESAEAKKALYQIGENFHGIAYYQRAAENYETFATK